MERWSGRVAMVTGASAGIGATIAVDLVKKGLRVVAVARRVERIKDLESQVKSAPGKLYCLKCDVSNEEDIKAAFKWVRDNLGGVDVLVNNAGGGSANSLREGPVESWRTILDLNVLGLSICTKEAIQCMKSRGVDDGHIIHIGSLLGHVIPPADHPFLMYSASKHAVKALTEGLRRELVNQKSKIRVSCISPGIVKTEFLQAAGKSDELYDRVPSLLSQDIADAVVYALGAPPHVQIHDIIIKPVGELL
ncbi:dehydrogenase/reductase SDR family member 11-like [Periplaneta americana]|uniref:dehydrogenase/reductase SDR family member 11-like n=1 Tax=Periplaneta americana TaxID=6978 RepID=UPI0037E9B07F